MAKLAGLYPAGALMEVMNEDGTMVRLRNFAKWQTNMALNLFL